MSISSRTPEGFEGRCLLCGGEVSIEFSAGADDAPCPHCGNLLMRSQLVFQRLQEAFSRTRGIAPEAITLETPLLDFDSRSTFVGLATDSMDVVELIMELEEMCDVTIPDDAAENMKTVGDFVYWLARVDDRRLT